MCTCIFNYIFIYIYEYQFIIRDNIHKTMQLEGSLAEVTRVVVAVVIIIVIIIYIRCICVHVGESGIVLFFFYILMLVYNSFLKTRVPETFHIHCERLKFRGDTMNLSKCN